jgi:hypothetical protein
MFNFNNIFSQLKKIDDDLDKCIAKSEEKNTLLDLKRYNYLWKLNLSLKCEKNNDIVCKFKFNILFG